MEITELFAILKAKADSACPASDLNATIGLNLTGPEAAQWHGLIADGRICLNLGELPEADITITASSDTAIGIYKKTINPMVAFMTGKIKLKGDVAKIALLKKLVGAR